MLCLCFDFLLSVDCPFWIAPSVFSNVYLPFWVTLVHIQLLWDSHWSIFCFVFVFVFFFVVFSKSLFVICPLSFVIVSTFRGCVFSCPDIVFVRNKSQIMFLTGESMSYLHYLCLFAHSGVQPILCCVFALIFFFLWVVLFWLPLRYYRTFICPSGAP